MWGHVIELVSQGSVPVSCDVSAVLVVLLRKMEEREAEVSAPCDFNTILLLYM